MRTEVGILWRAQPERIGVGYRIIPVELIEIEPAGHAERIFLGPARGVLIIQVRRWRRCSRHCSAASLR
jgi:hypothetical protein